jgi:hypothetical protein
MSRKFGWLLLLFSMPHLAVSSLLQTIVLPPMLLLLLTILAVQQIRARRRLPAMLVSQRLLILALVLWILCLQPPLLARLLRILVAIPSPLFPGVAFAGRLPIVWWHELARRRPVPRLADLFRID